MSIDYTVVPVSDRFKPVEIREADFIELPENFWTPCTSPWKSQPDGRGRAREVMLDLSNKSVVGVYVGGGNAETYNDEKGKRRMRLANHYVIDMDKNIAEIIKDKLPWEEYAPTQ